MRRTLRTTVGWVNGFILPLILFFLLVVIGGKAKPVAPAPLPAKTDAKTMTATITGYSVDRKQCGKTDGVTSTGINGKKIRGIAVDPTLIPYGSRIIIPNVGEFIADDTGGAMRQSWRKHGIPHFDLRFTGKDAKRQALAWGRKKLEVIILPPVS